MLSHVVGYMGVDGRGLAGVEAACDETLRGAPGEEEVALDGRGRRLGAPREPLRPAVDGRSIILTVDSRIQDIAEEELAAATCIGPNAPASWS